MKKKITLIFIIISLLVLLFTIKIGLPSAKNGSASSGGNRWDYRPKTSSEGPVTIIVTPLDYNFESSEWYFQVVLDTHTEELSQDLTISAELIDDKGGRYKPTAWEGDPPQGHHRKGILKFSAVKSRPRSVNLIIRNIGGIPERSFKWDS